MPEIDRLFAYRSFRRNLDLGRRWTVAGYARWLAEPFDPTGLWGHGPDLIEVHEFTQAAFAAGRKIGWLGGFSKMAEVFATGAQVGLIWAEGDFSYIVSQVEMPDLDTPPSRDEVASLLLRLGPYEPTVVQAVAQPIWAVFLKKHD